MQSGDRSSLVSVLHELGSACCEPTILEDILTQIIPSCKSPEAQIAQSTFMIAENSVTDTAWSPEVFTEVLLRTFPRIKRMEIVRELDFSNFYVAETRVAECLLKSWRLLFPKFYEDFPFRTIFMKWSNVKGQLSLVYNLLLLGPELINFGQFPASKVISNEDLSLSTTATKMMLVGLSNQTWNCYEIYDLNCQLVDTEFFEDVRPIFELASRQCSELLCIALAMFNPSWNSILKEILVKLTCGFLLGQPSSSIVLPRIWSLNPNIMLLCMVEMYRRDTTCLSRLLDVSQDLKILTAVLESKPYNFSLDMAALASRRQHLNLEKWLADAIKEKGAVFLKAAIEFALEKMRLQSTRVDRSVAPSFIPVAPEVIDVFAKVFQAASPATSMECQEPLRVFFQALSPESHGVSPGAPDSMVGGFAEGSSYPQDIEDEVNAVFEKIFSKEFPVSDVIELLKRLRASSVPRDQQLFSCMIQNLFDEYRFFAKYPDNELALTATIFGAIIKHHLISHVPLGVSLRYVLEALKRPVAHKLFKFGIHALIQFQRRLYEWPQYCSHLLQIPHLCQAYPDLVPFLQSIISGVPIAVLPFPDDEEKNRPREGAAPSGDAGGASVLDSREHVAAPNETVRDKILFIVNNLSVANVDTKVQDLRKLLNASFYPWFAQYLVVKRASLEVNFHHLYVQMLECFGDDKLIDAVLKETFGNIDVLLRSAKTQSSSSERTLLKNLGIWLGSLTLARDRPILHNVLSIKNTLLEAVVSNRLMVVVPFVCKVLEQGMYSRVFRPYNPYLMGSVRLLVELYKYADLKLNLKFEIEVLCKSLVLDLKDIKPTSILKDRSRMSRFSQPSSPVVVSGSLTSLPEHMSIPLVNSLLGLLQLNKLNPADFAFLLKIFPLAVEYAIRELAFSVSERSINIASVTAKALIAKDFSPLSDVKYVRSCALRLVQYLSSSLALASLKESIRPAVLSNMKTFLQISELSNPFSDAVWLGLIEENIENIASFIEQGTAEKVASDFDQIFSGDWIGTDHRAKRDESLSHEAYEGVLSQRRFGRAAVLSLSGVKSIVPGEYDQLVSSLRQLNLQPPRDVSERVSAKPVAPEAPTVAEVMEMFIKLLSMIEKACNAVEDKNVSKLHPESDVRRFMKQIIPLASSLPSHRDELCLLMCQRLMQLLYKSSNPLFADVIILLLVKIFEFSAKVAKEVTTWIIYSDDDRKYNVLATWALFNSGLVYVLDYDAQMARQIEKNPEVALKFAIELIRKCVFEEPSVAAPYDFVYSLEALKTAYAKSRQEAVKGLLDDLSVKTRALHSFDAKNSRESVVFCFTDWFRLCQYPSISDKLVESFMAQLFEYGFFREESSTKVFFQVCTESAVEIYVRQRRSPAILSYRSIEAYAKLMSNILRWTSRTEEASLSMRELLIIALKIVGVILAQGLEQGMDYLQRPFSRLLICLISEVGEREGASQNKLIMEIISEFMLSISPRKLPKFCFAWFEAVSHHCFLASYLRGPSCDFVVKWIVELLEFLRPIAQSFSFTEAAFVLYKGLLKLFAVILHDRPELFVAHYTMLCDHLPNNFVQLKNIVLAAVPHDIALPDPLSPGLKIDTLQGIRSKPAINAEYILQSVEETPFVSLVDDWLAQESTGNVAAIQSTVAALVSPTLCNAFVNLCAQRVLATANETTFKSANALLCAVVSAASPEMRYNLLSAMANHLRYPNYLTYFFSFAHLFAFRQAGGNDTVKSQIVRVLLERLVVYRPHPWGVMITFMELIRNPEYRFWSQNIVKMSPEIEKMFETVAKSCLIHKPA